MQLLSANEITFSAFRKILARKLETLKQNPQFDETHKTINGN